LFGSAISVVLCPAKIETMSLVTYKNIFHRFLQEKIIARDTRTAANTPV